MSKISSISINFYKNKLLHLFILMFIVINASVASVDSIPYPISANKLRLGWQTSGDGLLYRGLASDTITKPTNYVDKRLKAYVLLDTNTNIIWQYKKATSNAWLRLNLLPSDTSSMLTNYYRSGRALGTPTSGTLTNTTGLPLTTGVTGTLPVANGGTGSIGYLSGAIPYSNGSSLVSDTSKLFYDNTLKRLGINTSVPTSVITIKNPSNRSFENYTPSNNDGDGSNIIWSTNTTGSKGDVGVFGVVQDGLSEHSGRFYFQLFLNGSQLIRMNLDKNGNLFIGTGTYRASEKLHVDGNARITSMNGVGDIGASVTGVLQAATSDMNLKNTIENSPFGLNEILLLNPVTFLYNDENRKIDSDVKEVGFIAQDVFDIIPNAVSSTGTGDLQLDYRAITATLTKAIQQQQALIKALEQRILILENK